ncbi:MAG: copper resistance protein B, partial [Rhodospirillales bacterium]|nr:copper resistance protein B [Acetobacter sp.]
RKLAPYLGIAYQRRFGGTESLTRETDGKVNDTRFLVGLRTWF